MKNEEHRFQVAVATYLKYALPPEILWTATLNGAFLHVAQRVKLKAAGLRPGIADLLLVVPGAGVKMLELKALKGVLSPDQKLYQVAMGDAWATVRTIEDVETALIRWGVTPRCAVVVANRYALDTV